ncbi:MAG: radical SAM protein [Elusimicrobiota bacterium]
MTTKQQRNYRRMLSLGFIIPPDYLNFQPFKNQQLTALYLLTILENTFGNKLDLSIIDLRGISKDNISYYLPKKDVYCYTAFSPQFRIISEIKDHLRSMYPEAVHIISGPHIDLFSEQVAGFDTLALGEGEENIVCIVNDIFNGTLKHIYRNIKPIDINKFPFPLRKYQPVSAVVDTGFFYEDRLLRASNVLFSRGCPFRCRFCANLNSGPTRYRLPRLVEEEIAYLKKEYSVQALVLRDDNSIPVNKKVAKPFLQALMNGNVKWRGQARANGITEEMVALAAESGCLDLALGIESACPEVLDIVNKKIDLEETKRFIKILKKYKIGVKLLLVLGLPGEPQDIVSRMIAFINEADPDIVGLALFCPFPGSTIAANYKNFGIKEINPNLHEYHILYGRFDEKEKPKLMFEYNETTPWGKGMKPETIINNYNKLQDFVRKNHLIS